MRKFAVRDIVSNLPMVFMHFAAIGAFWVPWSPSCLVFCGVSYFIRMFAITAGYHRYFSHRSYKMRRIPQFLMAFLGGTALQKGALWWAAHHRWHHRHSDRSADIHSPVQRGFWWSHLGWILSEEHTRTRWELIGDLAQFPELKLLNRFEWLPGFFYGICLYILGGLPGVLWGFVISTVLLWHGTFLINSCAHLWGRQRYATGDGSRNSFILAFLTLGEGWHNNHHCYMSSAHQGFFWWEIDISYQLLKLLSYLGLVSDLRKAPVSLLEKKRVVLPTHSFSSSRLPVSSDCRP